MSVTRGIVLNGELDKIIIAASAPDVARFSKGQPVGVSPVPRNFSDTFARNGQQLSTAWSEIAFGPLQFHNDINWTVDPAQHPSMSHSMAPGQALQATLRTACGCERRIVVEYPPPPTYRLPLMQTLTPEAFQADGPQAQLAAAVREFAFQHIIYDDVGVRAIYKERL